MSKQFKTERASQQQSLICQGLVQLMLKRPYSVLTVSGICEAAAIPRRTFYYYFNCKEDVLTLLIEQLLKEADLESMLMNRPPNHTLGQAFTGFFLYWRDCRRDALEALVRNSLEQELMTQCLSWIANQTQDMPLPEDFTPQMRSVVMRLGISCVFYTLFDWCRGGFQESPEYMAQCVARVMLEPIYR